MPRPVHKLHHSQVNAEFSSLLVRQANRQIPDAPDVAALPAGTMVKRTQRVPDIVAQPVKFQSGISHRGAKAEQAWRYPNSQIVRAHSTTLGDSGRVYTDPKSEGDKPRRLQESNFFITINPNKKFADVDAAKAAGVMWNVLEELFDPKNVFKLITLGPKDPETYAGDFYEEVIRSIETTPTVEVGDKAGRMHSHVIVEIEHYSQVQINIAALRTLYIEAYNRMGAGMGMKITAGLRIKVDMLPQNNWTTISKQYVKKAIMAQL